MKIGFNPQSIVGLDGMPLVGRVTFYVHDSDVKATVYSMQGDAFVESQNPQLLNNAGRLDDTVFFDAHIIDVLVEKYIGEPGMMGSGSPDNDFETFDHFEVGFELNGGDVVPNVATIDDLQDADPSAGVVLVTGYYEKGDSPARFYVWDANSANNIDGGYVVGSNVSDSGRWIMLWDGDSVPSSVYGVIPGTSEANVSALLNYPDVVGSFLLKTAPAVRFVRGNYTTAVNFTTGKELVFDAGAKFTSTTFTCPKADVLGNVEGYVADLVFTSPDAVAHSSWFRTVNAFWHCGARVLYLDGTNFFTNTELTENADIGGKVVRGAGRIGTTYAEGKSIRVGSNTAITGRIFNPTYDCIRVGAGHGDEFFTESGTWDPGLISAGHRVEYEQVPEIGLFENAARWYAVMDERRGRVSLSLWSSQVLDFKGRTCGSVVDSANWQQIKNLVAAGGVIVKGDCVLDSVSGGVSVNGTTATVLALKGCKVNLSSVYSNLSAITSENSEIAVTGAKGIDPAEVSLDIRGGSFTGNVKLSDEHADSYDIGKTVKFEGVHFPTHFKWRLNVVSLTGCDGQLSVDVLPYRNGAAFNYSADFSGNTFTGNSRIWFTIYATSTHQHDEIGGNVSFNGVRIVNNRFNGNDGYGVKIMRRHPYTLLTIMSSDTGAYEYHGNGGACPRNSPGILFNEGLWTGEHTEGTVKWRTCANTYNIFAPYAVSTDGSVNTARDVSGQVPAPSGGGLAMVFATVGDSDNMSIVATGYQAGQSLPVDLGDLWDEDENNLLIVRPCITVGLPACPAFNAGYTAWFKPDVV